MPIDLPLSRYTFDFEVLDALQLPAQPGVLWHSVFGKNLKDLSCISKAEKCEQCMFLHQCDYTQLFKGTRPEQSEIMRKSDTIPTPHIFQASLNASQVNRVGETISINVVLCGKANEQLSALTRALYVAGLKGLGKQRSRVKLQQLTQHSVNGETKALLNDVQLLEALPCVPLPVSESPKSARLDFLTPYKPSGKANNGHGIDFGRFLMAIVRRVDLMQYFTTGIKLSEDFKALKLLTETIPVNGVDLTFVQGNRYSAANGSIKDTSGFMGYVEFDLRNHQALWPFLDVGQWLNVGKNSSMGFGRYSVQ